MGWIKAGLSFVGVVMQCCEEGMFIRYRKDYGIPIRQRMNNLRSSYHGLAIFGFPSYGAGSK
jgi:hypothetical protein